MNLQNVSTYIQSGRDEKGKPIYLSTGETYVDKEGKTKQVLVNLKELFIADSDEFELYNLDISNAEMRILCAYSEDPSLIKVFNDGLDIHCMTGAGISEFDYDTIKKFKDDDKHPAYIARQIAKKVNFGTIYCMGPATLAKKLWVDMRIEVLESKAAEYLLNFFKTYPGVKQYIDETNTVVGNFRMVWTVTGRRRRFPILSYLSNEFNRSARQAVNARIQTTSADLVADNVNTVATAAAKLGGRAILTVHDSILFQLPKDTKGVKAILDDAVTNKIAEECKWLPVAWKYDVGKGPSYGKAKGLVV